MVWNSVCVVCDKGQKDGLTSRRMRVRIGLQKNAFSCLYFPKLTPLRSPPLDTHPQLCLLLHRYKERCDPHREQPSDPQEMDPGAGMAVNIDEVLRLEAELKAFRERETSPVSLDAKVNLLKYFQVHAVKQYEEEYDNLYYELNRTGGLDCLRSIAPVRSTGVFQPKVLNLQDCSEDEQLEKQLEFYLADAELAKPRLDELVMSVADDMIKYEVQCVEVKSRESTRRKASTKHDGDVRKVADMARVTVICATPEALEEAYLGIMGSPKQRVLRVKNGFNSDWMPGGYRDVKLNPVVNEHLCEIQLQLREFFALKGGQHAVYEWARELTVTTEMRGEHPFKNTSPEVTKEMMRLAEENWYGTEPFLEDIQFAAGHYDLAEKSHRQLVGNVEHEAQEFEEHDSKESRQA
ncbi:unnamed protein product [Ectocarpus sp. 12 AP-2014]